MATFEILDVPDGDTGVYALAEAYFVERLIANYRPRGYDCYREYGYGGGSAFMPKTTTAGHKNSDRARILRMLQGGGGAQGFRFMKPRVTADGLRDRGYQKPDFLAFRTNDGVVGEVGTAAMRAKKLSQLNSRLRDLQRLVDEELRVLSHESAGRWLPWSGIRWRAADFHPPEGPVLIAIDEHRVISTAATFMPATPGLYLYQLLRYQSHRFPVGQPVTLPALTGGIASQLGQALSRYEQGAKGGMLAGMPSLRDALTAAAAAVGVAAVVIAAVTLVAEAGAIAAGAELIEGFGEGLVGELSPAAKVAIPVK